MNRQHLEALIEAVEDCDPKNRNDSSFLIDLIQQITEFITAAFCHIGSLTAFHL